MPIDQVQDLSDEIRAVLADIEKKKDSIKQLEMEIVDVKRQTNEVNTKKSTVQIEVDALEKNLETSTQHHASLTAAIESEKALNRQFAEDKRKLEVELDNAKKSFLTDYDFLKKGMGEIVKKLKVKQEAATQKLQDLAIASPDAPFFGSGDTQNISATNSRVVNTPRSDTALKIVDANEDIIELEENEKLGIPQPGVEPGDVSFDFDSMMKQK